MRLLLGLFAGLVLVPGANADEPSVAIRRLVEQLSSENFEARSAATRDLTKLKDEAFPILAETLNSGDPERVLRILQVVEAIWIAEDLEISEATEKLLELTVASGKVGADQAEAILSRHGVMRFERALRAFRRLRGRTRMLDDIFNEHEYTGLAIAPQIMLTPSWRGGEDGLWHVRRIHDALASIDGVPSRLAVQVIDGSGIDEAALGRLQGGSPNFDVMVRGPALLQFSPMSFAEHFLVDSVTPNGAADRAGIQSGDEIVMFDGQAVESFRQFVDLLRPYRPNQDIKVILNRGGEQRQVTVRLGSWDDMADDDISHVPPPPPVTRRFSPETVNGPLFR